MLKKKGGEKKLQADNVDDENSLRVLKGVLPDLTRAVKLMFSRDIM